MFNTILHTNHIFETTLRMTLNTRRPKKLKKQISDQKIPDRRKKKKQKHGRWWREVKMNNMVLKRATVEEKEQKDKDDKDVHDQTDLNIYTSQKTLSLLSLLSVSKPTSGSATNAIEERSGCQTFFENGILVGLFGKESFDIFGTCEAETCIFSKENGKTVRKHPLEIQYTC